MGLLARIWHAIRGGAPHRPPTIVELLQKAERARREGRLAEAEELVTQVLGLDPRHALGHLLAGYLHAAARRADAARGEFRAVLALDADHPRALLGLARLDFEGGDLAGARTLLEQALRAYPDFPEARSLLDLALSLGAGSGVAEPAAAPGPELRLQRVALPEGTRECLLVESGGAVLLSHPVSRTRSALAAHVVRVCAIATATLARASLGPVRRAAIASNSGTTFVVSDSRLILALTLGPDVDTAAGLQVAGDLWGRCLAELGATVGTANG